MKNKNLNAKCAQKLNLFRQPLRIPEKYQKYRYANDIKTFLWPQKSLISWSCRGFYVALSKQLVSILRLFFEYAPVLYGVRFSMTWTNSAIENRLFLAIEILRSNHFLRSMPDLLSGK